MLNRFIKLEMFRFFEGEDNLSAYKMQEEICEVEVLISKNEKAPDLLYSYEKMIKIDYELKRYKKAISLVQKCREILEIEKDFPFQNTFKELEELEGKMHLKLKEEYENSLLYKITPNTPAKIGVYSVIALTVGFAVYWFKKDKS